MSEDGSQRRFGVIATIASLYVLLGSVFVFLALTKAEFRGIQLDAWAAIVPAIIVLAGIGTLLKQNWGRRMSYVVSAIMLIGVPIGTLLGGFMIYYLTKSKDLFLTHHES